jgi:hypothetical protein
MIIGVRKLPYFIGSCRAASRPAARGRSNWRRMALSINDADFVQLWAVNDA